MWNITEKGLIGSRNIYRNEIANYVVLWFQAFVLQALVLVRIRNNGIAKKKKKTECECDVKKQKRREEMC